MLRLSSAVTVAGAAALSLVVCINMPIARAQDVIKIAAGAPITGQLAKQGQEVVNAVKLAAEDWNKKGGVLGKKIEVLEADDQGNPQVGVAAAEKVAADPAVMGSVWGITSVTCIPASEVLDRSNIVLISPGCTNPKVTDRGLKSVERVCARDDLQGPAAAVYMIRDLKMKKIAVFDDGTTGPRGIADAYEAQGKKMGATVLRFVIRAGDKDFRSILGTIPKDVDGIYAGIWAPDAALIAKQLGDVGLKLRMVGPDGQYEPVDYIQASAGAAEGNYVTFLVPDIRKISPAADFVKAFEAKYGTLSSYGPLAYEAANILLTAIQKVGKTDRAAIRDAVRATSNFQGILGFPLTFDEKGDVKGANVYIYQVKGDGFEQLTSITLSGS
jgi:branched-chain amino acid transport system substrate-binding protein